MIGPKGQPAKREESDKAAVGEAAVKKCPYCYGEIDARATICPHCGKNLREKTGNYQAGSFLMALGLLAALADLLLGTGILLVAGIVLFLLGWVLRRNA